MMTYQCDGCGKFRRETDLFWPGTGMSFYCADCGGNGTGTEQETATPPDPSATDAPGDATD